MRLRRNEHCPIHRSRFCCGRDQIRKERRLMRLGVQRIENPNHPRGYRRTRPHYSSDGTRAYPMAPYLPRFHSRFVDCFCGRIAEKLLCSFVPGLDSAFLAYRESRVRGSLE